MKSKASYSTNSTMNTFLNVFLRKFNYDQFIDIVKMKNYIK